MTGSEVGRRADDRPADDERDLDQPADDEREVDEPADQHETDQDETDQREADEPETDELPLPALETAAPVDPAELGAALEAILFVLDTPVSTAALAAGVQRPEPAVSAALDRLRAGYDERGAGIELRDVAGGVRLYTRPAHAATVGQFLMEGQRSRLSQAALETLAVIAYRQPVTRARVSAIRGVNVDGVFRTLLARGLIAETGVDADTGGGLFATTELFLERMGLRTLEELPSLAPLLPDVVGLDVVDADDL